jgi:hypothetical protein
MIMTGMYSTLVSKKMAYFFAFLITFVLNIYFI